MESVVSAILDEIDQFFTESNALRSLVILAVSLMFAFLLSKLVAWMIYRTADALSISSARATSANRALQLRRVETYLSVTVALVRAVIVGFVAFFVWQALSPTASVSAAAIGAGAFFVVIAGGTMGLILRDITSGSAMIIERWFNVGDFIRVEPFMNVAGVVEKMTLRSTKLRNIEGEVVWMHNQHIQAVKVTEGGLRRLAVDIFVRHEAEGQALIKGAIASMPSSALTIAEPLKITHTEKWADGLWAVTVTGSTVPGREWLVEEYFVASLKEIDDKNPKLSILARPPIVRQADPKAEQSFRRAMLPKNSVKPTKPKRSLKAFKKT